jgi:apolipoprotein D and lipocalin family protein
MRNILPVLGAVIVASIVGCATSTSERLKLPPLKTVPVVELSRYLGTWYEIASFPQSFQEGCHGTSATYALRDDGTIDVLNRCRKGSLDGEENVANGRARVVDPVTNAKLQVSFFGPFWGDYWVIDLGADYEFAVVGHPGRDYLWILSRTRVMEPAAYEGVLARLKEQHYDLTRLALTPQPAQ